MNDSYIFSSESVSPGHPDKLADQISDAILDALLQQAIDTGAPAADVRCAAETLVKTGMVVLAGEIRGGTGLDFETIVRQVVCDVGYTHSDLGFDGATCAVLNALGQQSLDIALGVDSGEKKDTGAGDQGIMFGYACRESDNFMPISLDLSHRLLRQHHVCRTGALPWLRPDAKSQVSIRYENGKPTDKIEAIVLSTQHAPQIDGAPVVENDPRLRQAVIDEIIKPTIGGMQLPDEGNIYINPTGLFVQGGPLADCGLTGRKIIVDTYGGAVPHGGGAFSGKDPTKVDRSAAYMMRYLAKNIVASGLVDKCLIQIAYAIGVSQPVSMMVNTYGQADDGRLRDIIADNIDCTPAGIINRFELHRPIYRPTATYGHFGNDSFPWEQLDIVELFQ